MGYALRSMSNGTMLIGIASYRVQVMIHSERITGFYFRFVGV